jgi:hypothetical protein
VYSATPHPKIGGPDFDKKTFSLAMDAVLVRYGSGAGEGGERRKHEAERKGLQTSQQAEKETQKKGLEALEQRRRVKLGFVPLPGMVGYGATVPRFRGGGSDPPGAPFP